LKIYPNKESVEEAYEFCLRNQNGESGDFSKGYTTIEKAIENAKNTIDYMGCKKENIK